MPASFCSQPNGAQRVPQKFMSQTSMPRAPVGTLNEALERAAHDEQGTLTFYDHDDVAERWTYAEFVREAKRRGRYFSSLGLRAGDTLGLVVPEYADFALSFFAAVSVGVLPVPMATPLGLHQPGYLTKAEGILAASDAQAVVVGASVAEVLAPLTSRLRVAVPSESLRENRAEAFLDFDGDFQPNPNDACFLQFTSGSTSEPKGVVVSHDNLVTNARVTYLDRFAADPARDVALSWLPLYHDMGLIGFLTSPMIVGLSSVMYPTSTFMWRPSSWMQRVHQHRATISFAPNFAFALAARRQKRVEELDLSCLRILGCGAEPICADTLRRFVQVFAPARLRPEAVLPAYGMAEHTLAATCASVAEPLRTVWIDREAYETRRQARPTTRAEDKKLEIVSCGQAFPGHAVAIMGTEGALLGPGEVGEIVLQGPSCTRGYYRHATATQALFAGAWLRTGDLGFMLEDNLYVSGRVKDVVIINGKNHYPQDIEWEVQAMAGIRPGAVVAFSVPKQDTECLVLVVEAATTQRSKLRESIERQLSEAAGLSPADVAFVAPGTIPKTSSGKLQRRKARAAYLAGSLNRLPERPDGRAPSALPTAPSDV